MSYALNPWKVSPRMPPNHPPAIVVDSIACAPFLLVWYPMQPGTTGDALSRRLPSPRALMDGLCGGRSGSQAGAGSFRHMAPYASTLSDLLPTRGAPGAVAHRGLRVSRRQYSGLTLVDQHSANSARHHLNLHFTDPPSTKTPIRFTPPAPARLAG